MEAVRDGTNGEAAGTQGLLAKAVVYVPYVSPSRSASRRRHTNTMGCHRSRWSRRSAPGPRMPLPCDVTTPPGVDTLVIHRLVALAGIVGLQTDPHWHTRA